MFICPNCGIASPSPPPIARSGGRPIDAASARQLRRIEAELARVGLARARAAIEPQTAPVPIEDLKLSTRVNNALKRKGIDTLATLVNCSNFDLLDIRNFGPNSLGEVQLALHFRGLRLRKERLLPRTGRARS